MREKKISQNQKDIQRQAGRERERERKVKGEAKLRAAREGGTGLQAHNCLLKDCNKPRLNVAVSMPAPNFTVIVWKRKELKRNVAKTANVVVGTDVSVIVDADVYYPRVIKWGVQNSDSTVKKKTSFIFLRNPEKSFYSKIKFYPSKGSKSKALFVL
jgi:hypothetical protein